MLLMFRDLQNIHFLFVLLMLSQTHISALMHACQRKTERVKKSKTNERNNLEFIIENYYVAYGINTQ